MSDPIQLLNPLIGCRLAENDDHGVVTIVEVHGDFGEVIEMAFPQKNLNGIIELLSNFHNYQARATVFGFDSVKDEINAGSVAPSNEDFERLLGGDTNGNG